MSLRHRMTSNRRVSFKPHLTRAKMDSLEVHRELRTNHRIEVRSHNFVQKDCSTSVHFDQI